MALPLKPWSTSYPEAQDTPEVEQPNLTNESAPEAGDGDVVLVEHLHAIRDKAQALAETIGSDLVESGSLLERVATLEGGTSSSPLTTKGDLYAFSIENTRRSVGSNGQVLRADSNDATGLAWGALTYDDILAAYAVSASLSVTEAEVGASIVNPTVSASVNRTPAAATANDGVHGVEAFSPLGLSMTHVLAHTYHRTTAGDIGAADTVTVLANEAGGPTKAAYCGLTWKEYAGWGVALDPSGVYDAAFVAVILGQSKLLATARQRTEAFNAAGMEYEWFVWPASFGGAPADFIDTGTGFAAGYAQMATGVAVTNVNGVVVNYVILRSTNFGIGARNVQVT